MIDNIKRFVNKHHTLMVIIIGVLVICFLYWFFCCKDRPLENEVKRGTLDTEFYKECTYSTSPDITESKIFQCAGINIKDVILFTVLNEDGRWLIEKFNDIFKKYTIYVNKHVESSSEVVHNIIIVIDAPLSIFVPGINSGSVHENFIEYSKANTEISTVFRKRYTIKTMNEVKFSDIRGKTCTVSKTTYNIGEMVYQRYRQLVDFLKNGSIYHYIEEVSFIGQPSVYASNIAQASEINNNGNELERFGTAFSPDVKSNLRFLIQIIK